MANLLSYKPSFLWEDTTIDRGESINNLNLTIQRVKEYKDEIFKTPDFEDINLTWGNFFEFVYGHGFDAEQRITRFPWMTQIQHTTLVYMLGSFKNTTVLNAVDLEMIREELEGTNCGNIGFDCTPKPESFVCCVNSLDELHRKFVSNFNYVQRCQNFRYFKKFFLPELTISLNQIQNGIETGKYPKDIIRIDDAKVVGEKVHIHFGGRYPCALNIDGTWKHPNDKYKIPVDCREVLCRIGFLLPDEYYI